MLRLAARNLSARKLRAFSTALAVFFGVAMVAGTLLLTDSVNRSFDSLFANVNEGIDVTVRERTVVEDPFADAPASGFDASLLADVQAVSGVARAEGVVGDGTITILGDDGERIGQTGPPHIAVSVTNVDEFDPTTLVGGDIPANADQVSIDSNSAETEGFEVGNEIRIVGAAGAKTYEISGIFEFGSGTSLLGASIAAFTLPEAQRLTGKEGRFDEIDVLAQDGTPPETLARRVAAALGSGFDVQTGSATGAADANDISGGFSFLTTALLVFAGIAVFVGGFLIFNTFSITIAQRTREFAMLRTLGANRRQVLGAVLGEALMLGLIASALGIAGGFGFVEFVKLMFGAAGFDLPVSDLRLSGTSILIPTLVGVLSTVAAALMPAVRATRVAPLEALRESGGSTEATRTRKRKTLIASLVLAISFALIGLGLFGGGSEEAVLSSLGGGLVLLFIGVAMLGSRLVPPVASAIGWPIERLRGVTGRLARENSQREPGRTATTAAALMIGVALVVFVGVFASSLKATITDSVDRQFAGDLSILSTDGFSPISPQLADELEDVEGVAEVAPASAFAAKVNGVDGTIYLAGIAPESVADVVNFDWVDGSDETLAELQTGGAIAEASWAEANGIEVGDDLTITGPTGEQLRAFVAGTVKDRSGLVVESLAVAREATRLILGVRDDFIVLLNYEEGAEPAAVREAVDAFLTDRFPNAEALDQAELKAEQEQQIDQLVTLIYVLLGLSIIVSIFGVVNTLALTILERTRELAMLRAIGTSRRQIRRMVRYESVINSLLGTSVGAVIGLALAIAAVKALDDEGIVLSIPAALPFVVLIAALVLGVVAAIRPARRASRLDVIESLQYE
ncbi:ABC transporter permease [soil metagenome]